MSEHLREPKRNLTNWFIHEATNSLGPFIIEDVGIKWEEEDFTRGREILENFRTNLFRMENECDNGHIPKAKILGFIDEALRQNWNEKTTKRLYSKFMKLSG